MQGGYIPSVNQAAPFLVFAFFLALFWLRNRGREHEPVPPREPGLGGFVLGNPPVNSRADAFVRFGFFAAWAIGLVGIVGNVIELIAPAGVLIIATGVLVARNVSGVRDQLIARSRRSIGYRTFGAEGITGPMFGVLMVIVGLIWLAIGTAALLR